MGDKEGALADIERCDMTPDVTFGGSPKVCISNNSPDSALVATPVSSAKAAAL
jgi:hypothetical protein